MGSVSVFSEITWSLRFVDLLLTSGAALACYFIGLDRAYRLAPVALVYPLVRSSPLLIAIWSYVLFAQSLRQAAWLGIGVSVIGLLVMARTGRDGEDGCALPWALLAMLATSIYSISDKAALVQLTSLGAIVGFITVGYAISWLALSVSLHMRTGRWTPPKRIGTSVILIGGICIGMSYALVVYAMRFMPAAEAVSYSNAGIVVASLISIFAFGEKHRWKTRLAGGVIICVGLVIMAVRRS